MRVLVAEDDLFFRTLLQRLLEADFEVCTAENGTEAWRILQEDPPPQLAILDWVMPGIIGPQVCRQVRADAKAPAIYLVLLTSRDSAADILAGLRAGADDFVTKPFQPEELRARVHVGKRIIELQQELNAARTDLHLALQREHDLQAELAALRQPTKAKELAKGISA